ncbi:NapC/NirT family cytochrome c [Nibricoccus sp. IMCC34717]|uniref:NapC/NirT family cytochrome c n=1 Tax=Nibricoccus sp. IMCC34717 TaxID=3034021 RepID=UPI00384DAB78
MSAPPPVPSPDATPPRREKSHFNNWITAIGAVIALGSLFSFALLAWVDYTQHQKNPYLGIFTYLVAPAFLILGLVLVFFGAWAQRRWAIKHALTQPDRWRLDFNNRHQRRILWGFGAGAVVFLLLSVFGSYKTYQYAESVEFCGQVCHRAMNPEFVTYQRGSHARVDCVECHVGDGAEWFVKAKINGTHQLIAYSLDNYKRPIETPLKNLRPAQEICEQCHWPEKFHGNVEMNFQHFLSDKKNTPYTARMLLHVNKSAVGSPPGGIHWHVNENERVEYYATDEKRQVIPWMRVTNLRDGSARVFKTLDFTGEPPADKVRVMDCMDCHNRPAHLFPTANDSIERALATGKLTRLLPNIKRVAVDALMKAAGGQASEAKFAISQVFEKAYQDPAFASLRDEAASEVTRVFGVTVFPERKADWRVYPNNIGHKDWAGCFRCHDNQHRSESGQAVRSSDCSSCHTLLAQGAGESLETLSAKGLEFDHPGGGYDDTLTCAECHTGENQK